MTRPIEQCYAELGRWCSERRKQADLTQQQVADLVGLSRASVVNFEAGRQRVLYHQALHLQLILSDESVAACIRAKEDAVIQQADDIKLRRTLSNQETTHDAG